MAHLSGCAISNNENPARFSEVKIGEQSFEVEVVDDDESRQKGLMFREKLEQDKGMFFIFDYEGKHSFWMKNTLIPLDIIWISEDKKIVDVQTMQPCITEKCESHRPEIDSKYVLEVGAGIFRGKTGDLVEISF